MNADEFGKRQECMQCLARILNGIIILVAGVIQGIELLPISVVDMIAAQCKRAVQIVPLLVAVVLVLKTFPILPIPGLADKVFPGQKTLVTMVDKLVTEHKRTWDPDQPPRDLTDAFLAEIEKAKWNPESSFNDANLCLVVLDLFGAGIMTTSITLTRALLLMILHSGVQYEVHQEIDEVIGQVRHPEMEDQALVPYTSAVIHEVQRFADTAPMTLLHTTSPDIEVQGFLISKGLTYLWQENQA
ncbi:cytochrome P450 2D3-like [Arvicanthis niloticus]|uniref:cytochrome P450 2D3-like n=1 Tax=Arvicanthis niloticus TaxID=61156 RepID=UPI001487134D|nr:cytochrome P450 2D3-like [Arvicanthis niloticus]